MLGIMKLYDAFSHKCLCFRSEGALVVPTVFDIPLQSLALQATAVGSRAWSPRNSPCVSIRNPWH